MKRQIPRGSEAPAKKRKTTAQTIARNPFPAVNVARSPGFNPEVKAVDITGSLALNNTGVGSGHTALLNGLVLGTDRFNRIGRRINVKKISVKMQLFTLADPVTVVDDVLRFALIWDEQPTGVLPTASDLWQTVTAAGVASTNLLSHNNLNNSARFKMLRTHTVTIVPELQGLESYKERCYWEWNVPLNVITQYNTGNTGGLADITTGAIYIVGHGNASAVAQWGCNYDCRTKYLD